MLTAVMTDVIATESQNILQVYRRNPVVFERGEGCRLYTAEGRAYLDLVSGVGVAALGHAHPKLAAAIAAHPKPPSAAYLLGGSPGPAQHLGGPEGNKRRGAAASGSPQAVEKRSAGWSRSCSSRV